MGSTPGSVQASRIATTNRRDFAYSNWSREMRIILFVVLLAQDAFSFPVPDRNTVADHKVKSTPLPAWTVVYYHPHNRDEIYYLRVISYDPDAKVYVSRRAAGSGEIDHG
jgi:hypothetical protein